MLAKTGMKRWFFDFESFWSADYSLTKMTPVDYILDPRFEALGCAIIDPDGKKFWVAGPDLRSFFDRIDWDDAMVVSHNALSDMLILSLRFGHTPVFYGDTLAMARNWISYGTGRPDLVTCAGHYGRPSKGKTVEDFKGLGFAAIKQQPELYDAMVRYALHDVTLCQSLFIAMLGEGFPVKEFEVIDMVVRMAAQPQFEVDPLVLSEHL